MNRRELGCPGHFICAASCRYRRHTQVAGYRISTVGELFYSNDPKRQTVGVGEKDFYETMVFATTNKAAVGSEGCGCKETKDWDGIEQIRNETAGAAHRTHERMVHKYMKNGEKT